MVAEEDSEDMRKRVEMATTRRERSIRQRCGRETEQELEF